MAVGLLRSLKDVLEKTYSQVDVQIVQNTGQINRVKPVKIINFSKEKYEEVQNKMFNIRLYNIIPQQAELNLMEKHQNYGKVQRAAEKRHLEIQRQKHMEI